MRGLPHIFTSKNSEEDILISRYLSGDISEADFMISFLRKGLDKYKMNQAIKDKENKHN